MQSHPELIQQYLGTVVPYTDNFFATLNSAVFSDGSFVYIPKGVRCPMELSTYFRINERNTGQFERTLIIADEGSHVSYLESFLSKTSHSAVAERLNIPSRLQEVKEQLARVSSDEHLSNLVGTIGRQPI